MAGQCGIRTGLERQLWFVESRCGQSGIGAADKESCGSCGEVLHGTVSCGGDWCGRLGKFCRVEPGPGSARTGKARFGRHGELRKVCSGQPRRGTVWQGRQELARIGLAKMGWLRRGTVRHGMERQARNGLFRYALDGLVRQGWERWALSRQAWKPKGGKTLVYQFKLPGLYPVSAQTAGEELHRIYTDKGQLKPADIVDESRPESAPLHPCFEWNDKVAAEEYRKVQAGNLIRSITVLHETPTHEPVEVRAFVKPLETYAPIEVVVNSEEQMTALLESALAELKSFEKKYATLSKLSPIFEEIKKLTA